MAVAQLPQQRMPRLLLLPQRRQPHVVAQHPQPVEPRVAALHPQLEQPQHLADNKLPLAHKLPQADVAVQAVDVAVLAVDVAAGPLLRLLLSTRNRTR